VHYAASFPSRFNKLEVIANHSCEDGASSACLRTGRESCARPGRCGRGGPLPPQCRRHHPDKGVSGREIPAPMPPKNCVVWEAEFGFEVAGSDYSKSLARRVFEV
jgi:hypothetical protein